MQPDYYKIRTTMPINLNGKRDVGALRADRKDLIQIDYMSLESEAE